MKGTEMGKEEFIEALGASEPVMVGKSGALSAVEVLSTLDWYEREIERVEDYCDYCEQSGHTFRTCPKRDDG